MALVLVPLDRILPLILPNAPGCPHMTALLHARMAAVEFCERTRCWRHATTLTVTGVDEALVTPAEAAIHEIETASANGVPLTPTQFTDIVRWGAGGGPPQYITQTNANSVSVFPNEGEVELELTLFLKPRSDSARGTDPADPLRDPYDVVPDWMISQHADILAAGALSRVLLIPDQPWTDPKAAAFHLARFLEGKTDKFASNLRGQQRARARTRAHWF